MINKSKKASNGDIMREEGGGKNGVPSSTACQRSFWSIFSILAIHEREKTPRLIEYTWCMNTRC